MQRARFSLLSAILLMALSLVFLAACNQQQPASNSASQESEQGDTPASDQASEEPAEKPETGKEASVETSNTEQVAKERVVIETAKGKMVIELYPGVAPKTVDNFVKLIQKDFYNGLKFHRVVAGFVIQGGDPKGDGTGGPGYMIPAEFNEKKHLRGTVAMARSSLPDSAGSQFYICIAPQPSLDGQYTVFGQVIEGLEVIDKIAVDDVMNRVYLETPNP